jgi:hypothetical protein
MTPSRESSSDLEFERGLDSLVANYERLAAEERAACQSVEPVSAACRAARQELYVQAALAILDGEDPAEIATRLTWDLKETSTAFGLAQQLAHAIEYELRQHIEAAMRR